MVESYQPLTGQGRFVLLPTLQLSLLAPKRTPKNKTDVKGNPWDSHTCRARPHLPAPLPREDGPAPGPGLLEACVWECKLEGGFIEHGGGGIV